MKPFETLRSRAIPLVRDDIDTDQIVPARFLKVTDKAGLGDNLFTDWRYDDRGAPRPEFVLNQPDHQGAEILLVGDNFGCGSSREHAPWALVGWGLRAIIARSFADIFRNNALKNGLLPIAVDDAIHRELRDLIAADPTAELIVDLPRSLLILPDGRETEFPIDEFAARCLIEGIDELGYIQSFESEIATFERRRARL